MNGRYGMLMMIVCLCILAGCSATEEKAVEIRRFPVDSASDLITRNNVSTDSEITRDGRGSVRVEVSGPTTVRLYQIGGMEIDEATLVYRGALKTRDLDGETYLEMWCSFPGRGEYYSRGLDHTLSGTNDWTDVSTAFRLKKGEIPDVVKLNLHVKGTGTVWIDDIRLEKGPLK
jgi:hypothetical protein